MMMLRRRRTQNARPRIKRKQKESIHKFQAGNHITSENSGRSRRTKQNDLQRIKRPLATLLAPEEGKQKKKTRETGSDEPLADKTSRLPG
jgi:hypothetical protein